MKKILTIPFVILLFINVFGQKNQVGDAKNCPFELTNVHAITPDGEHYTRPKISPDGTKVFFTTSSKKGLYLIDLKNKGVIKTITEDAISDGNYKWINNGKSILFYKRNLVKTNGLKRRLVKYSIENYKEEIIPDNNMSSLPGDDKIIVSLNLVERKVEATDGLNTWFVTSEPGGYYNFILSPDKKWVIIHDDHIYVYAIDGSERIDTGIETGIATDWFFNGKYFLYFVEKDDGHTYLGSDLYIYSIYNKKSWKITDTSDLMEARSSMSADGEKISFVDYSSGKIFVADLKTKKHD